MDARSDETVSSSEEALTLKTTPTYEIGVDSEFTSLLSPWINRNPAEVFTFASFGLYTSVTAIRHQFPTGNSCSWVMKTPKQGLRSGDLRKGDLTLKLLFQPTLSAQLITPAAVA